MKNEIWKPVPIPEYNGKYEVSNLGRVRSVDRIITSKRNAKIRYKGRVMTPRARNGYLCVHIYDGFPKVHKLVASGFFGIRPPGIEINHINGIKTDNRIANLEYVTRRENVMHAYRLGLQSQKGEKNGNHKLTEAHVKEIRSVMALYSDKELARMYNINFKTVWSIKKQKIWNYPSAMPEKLVVSQNFKLETRN